MAHYAQLVNFIYYHFLRVTISVYVGNKWFQWFQRPSWDGLKHSVEININNIENIIL